MTTLDAICGLALGTLLLAAPLAAADWAADKAEIRRQLAASTEAFNHGDLTGHLAIYDASVRTPAGWRAVHDHSS